jgi:hypothetical protein
MEFKINKIDPEVRQRIRAITKEGVVHNKTNIKTDKDKKEDGNKDNKSFEEALKKFEKTSKEKIIVSAEKIEDIEVTVFRDKKNLKDAGIGSIIDTRK